MLKLTLIPFAITLRKFQSHLCYTQWTSHIWDSTVNTRPHNTYLFAYHTQNSTEGKASMIISFVSLVFYFHCHYSRIAFFLLIDSEFTEERYALIHSIWIGLSLPLSLIIDEVGKFSFLLKSTTLISFLILLLGDNLIICELDNQLHVFQCSWATQKVRLLKLLRGAFGAYGVS